MINILTFPVYFQRRFRQDPHQNLEKNSNCQVLAINVYVLIVCMYHNLRYLCPLIQQAVLKPLKRYSICEFQVHVVHFQCVICIFAPEESARNATPLAHRGEAGDFCRLQVPVVQKVDNAIHQINHYPVDSVVCFVNTYPLDSVIQPLNNRGQKEKCPSIKRQRNQNQK